MSSNIIVTTSNKIFDSVLRLCSFFFHFFVVRNFWMEFFFFDILRVFVSVCLFRWKLLFFFIHLFIIDYCASGGHQRRSHFDISIITQNRTILFFDEETNDWYSSRAQNVWKKATNCLKSIGRTETNERYTQLSSLWSSKLKFNLDRSSDGEWNCCFLHSKHSVILVTRMHIHKARTQSVRLVSSINMKHGKACLRTCYKRF